MSSVQATRAAPEDGVEGERQIDVTLRSALRHFKGVFLYDVETFLESSDRKLLRLLGICMIRNE